MAAHRSTRIALVTTDLGAINEDDRDLPLIIQALGVYGIEATPVRWREHDPTVLAQFDAVVFRSPWDYPEHFDAFMQWAGRVALVAPLFNEIDTVLWNVDKAYLVELADRGLPVVPTIVADTISQVEKAVATYAVANASIIIKPSVSVGSRDTGLFGVDDHEALQLAEQIIEKGKRVIVQPAITSVQSIGERALICINGTFSHAVTKGPILRHGGGMIGGRYTEVITATTPTNQEIALAERAVALISDVMCGNASGNMQAIPLYARIDLVETPLGPLLLEAELIEPSLFLDNAPRSAERFADALVKRLKTDSADLVN